MKKSWKSTQPKGIEEHLKDLCLIYRGEMDNPHDVNALLDEECAQVPANPGMTKEPLWRHKTLTCTNIRIIVQIVSYRNPVSHLSAL